MSFKSQVKKMVGTKSACRGSLKASSWLTVASASDGTSGVPPALVAGES